MSGHKEGWREHETTPSKKSATVSHTQPWTPNSATPLHKLVSAASDSLMASRPLVGSSLLEFMRK